MTDMKVSQANLLYSIDQNGNGDGKVDQADVLNDLDGVAGNPTDGVLDANEQRVLRDVAPANNVSDAFMQRLIDIGNGSGEVLDAPTKPTLSRPSQDQGVRMRRRRPGKA